MDRSSQRGFTLMELLIAAAILTVISAAALGMIVQTHRSYATERGRTDASWVGRSALDLMVRELRLAGYPPANTFAASAAVTPAGSNLVAHKFLAAAPAQVVFEADLDLDGIVERVEYRISGNRLERSAVSKNANGSVPEPQYELLTENVANAGLPLFTYRTDPQSSLSFPSNVNSVEVRLLLRTSTPDPQNFQTETLRFEGVAFRQNPER